MSSFAGEHFAQHVGAAIHQRLAGLGDHLLDPRRLRENLSLECFQITFQML